MEVKPTITKSSVSSNKVKSKFFNTIGIHSSSQNDTYQLTHNKYYRHPREKNITYLSEKLKYNREEEEQSDNKNDKWSFFMRQNKSNEPNDEESNKKDGGVKFVDTVKVLPIPMRDEYSDRIAKRIWSSAQEIHEMAMRNTVEFAAEGWDWRTVTEDEKMYLCKDSGELIHPCHFQSEY